MCYVLSLCASCLGYSALLRIHRVTLDDVFLDPLWFFNYKKILWGGYRLYVGPRLYFRASPYLWLRLYLWARLKSICDWLRKGRGGAQAGCESGRASPDHRHLVHPGVRVHPNHRVIQTSSHCLWLSL